MPVFENPAHRPKPRDLDLDGLEAVVAAAFAIPLGELRARTRRSAPAAFARQSAMYLAHIALGLSYAEIGRLFGRDRTTAAHACRLIEERRDDPLLDLVLSALEGTCGRDRRTPPQEGLRP